MKTAAVFAFLTGLGLALWAAREGLFDAPPRDAG